MRLRVFKIIPIFFVGSTKIRKLFFGKIYTRTPPQTRIIPNHSKPDKYSKNTKFSDVNAIAGNQGYLQTVFAEKPCEICAKKSDQQNLVKLQDEIAI